MRYGRLLPTTITAALLLWPSMGADWPQFRGPGGSGVDLDAAPPVAWSDSENVLWKTELPGFGASSPITLQGKIYLTCYSGYGLDQDNPGEQENLKHVVVCIDPADGSILWQQATKAEMPETAYRGFVALHGYASGTPATDGRGVYVFFGRSGVMAYSRSGRLVWRAEVGSKTHGWGSGTSPVICGDLVIVNASVESQSIVALDKLSGKEVWRTEGIRESWSTPALAELPDGSRELVVSSARQGVGP